MMRREGQETEMLARPLMILMSYSRKGGEPSYGQIAKARRAQLHSAQKFP
jgi:hypothetical protein